jgi:hypothetical protein
LKTGLRTVALLFALLIASTATMHAQATDTASQALSLSAFGGINGTYTGLPDGKNLGITAGVDLRILSYRHFLPSIEVRGTEPIHKGPIDSQKDVLAGVKVERIFDHRIRPYGDFMIGRGEIDYQSGGYINPAGTFDYLYTVSNIYAFGGGVDLDLTDHYAIKFDGQLQHYVTPVTTSGSLYAKALTAGVIYRFDFNHHNKGPK